MNPGVVSLLVQFECWSPNLGAHHTSGPTPPFSPRKSPMYHCWFPEETVSFFYLLPCDVLKMTVKLTLTLRLLSKFSAAHLRE